MREMKYVIMQLGNTSTEVPILFPVTINHSEVTFSQHGPVGIPVAAGMVQFYIGDGDKINASVYGKSLSLKLDSRPDEDKFLIELMINDFY